MKKLLILLSFMAFSATAQKEVSAKTIFELIDKGRQVEYDGVTIVGDLDLTELSNKRNISKNKGYAEYKCNVEVPLIFKNCRFKGDFIAYKHDEDGKSRKFGSGSININWGDGVTYSTDFEKNVVFENCTFEGKSEFKYSDFEQDASFGGAKFNKEANFKYADFKRNAIFAKTDFDKTATFKYTKFSNDADFYDVNFRGYADFKYTNFDDRVTFKSSNFSDYADFKYTNFDDNTNFDNTRFSKGVDFKYSNGKKYVGR